jgi:hypothetical protein
VSLKLDWPDGAKVRSLRVRFQTSIDGPWIEAAQSWDGDAPSAAALGVFDRETPVSYRVDAVLEDGATAELWGYLQVRRETAKAVEPLSLSPDLIVQDLAEGGAAPSLATGEAIDLLEKADPASCWAQGEWSKDDGKLLSPKQFGARLELPFSPPAEYRLTLIVEPLDDPNGLILGQRSGGRRFATLFSYTPDDRSLSAIEDIGGRNVGNESTFEGEVFRRDQLSQVIVTVKQNRVTMSVDGRTIVDWEGAADQLSLSDYWSTPDDTALFLGAYDCRYRFHRITLEPLSK